MKTYPTDKEKETGKRDTAIALDYGKGMPMAEIARKYGVSRQRIWQILGREGLSTGSVSKSA